MMVMLWAPTFRFILAANLGGVTGPVSEGTINRLADSYQIQKGRPWYSAVQYVF